MHPSMGVTVRAKASLLSERSDLFAGETFAF